MANQAPPVTDAVQDYYPEKIILSGSFMVSSILGPGAHRITNNAPPVFYTEPVITGSLYPPSVLSCGEGSFNSSPRAVLSYQWKRNGGDITDETSNTYDSVLSDIGYTITCEVTIDNSTGSDTGLSNGLLMAARLPQNAYQLDVMPIQGLSTPTRLDATDLIIFYVQGMVNEVKTDNNEMDVYAMAGMSLVDWLAVDESDLYAMFHPVSLDDLVVVNGDAENSNMSDWTMDTNTVTSVTTAPGYSATNREGARFFMPEQLGQGVDSQMSQVIVIPGGDLTDVDTGLCYCIVRFRHMSDEGYDKLVITLDALNAADGVLATKVYSPDAGPEDRWLIDSNGDDPLSLPTLTRKVKITVLFDAHATSGTTVNSVYADDFSIELMKTA